MTITPLGIEGPGHTYAYNRRLRRLANKRSDHNPTFGQRITGPKSEAHLARIARRLAARVRAKQHAEALRAASEQLKTDRNNRNRTGVTQNELQTQTVG